MPDWPRILGSICTCLIAASTGCGSATPEPEATPVALPPPEVEEPPIPQDILQGESITTPQEVFFPGMSVLLMPEAQFLGHFAGLIPVTLLDATPGQYQFRMTLHGRPRLAMSETIGVAPYVCFGGRATFSNGDIRAELHPGSVVRLVASDETYARVQVGNGLTGVVRRADLSIEGCISDTPELSGGRLAEAPSYAGLALACLYPSTEVAEGIAAAEIPGGWPVEILEERPGWWRVRARLGATIREGWLPNPADLPPDQRPPLRPRRSPGLHCRTITRPITVGSLVPVMAPEGSVYYREEVSTSQTLYVPWQEGSGYLIVRTRDAVPEDAIGEPRACSLGVWEDWDGYVGRCFYPGRELAETAADVSSSPSP